MMAKDQVKQALPRKIKALLFVSLAMNLVVIGLVIGAALHRDPQMRHPRKDPVLWSLEKSERRDVGKAVRDARGGGRRTMARAMGAALEEIRASLVAQPFDEAAFREAMAAKSALLSHTRDAAEAAIIAQIVAMSDAERVAMAERLSERLDRAIHWRK